MKDFDFVIIGGGCAGLSLAYELEINNKLKDKIKILKDNYNVIPSLVVIVVGEHPASQVYVKNKSIQAHKVGIKSIVKKLDKTVSEDELLKLIALYNSDEKVDGILLQLPIPQHIDSNKIIEAISYEKDVDGFNSKNK